MAFQQHQKIGDDALIRHKLFDSRKSSIQKYRELVTGAPSVLQLLKYELLTTFLGPIPGAIGLALRKLFYPLLFKKIGKGVVFGRSVVIRHPEKVLLGNRVVLDDYSLIDARGAGDEGIVVGDDSIINRGVSIQAKVGPIHIDANVNVGASSMLVSMGGIYIGGMVAIGGGCNISGGGFTLDRNEESLREQEKYTAGPIRIDKKARLGMGAMVLDGVHIGEGCIIGAGSVVTKDLDPYSVAAGVPAKVIRSREAGTQDALRPLERL